MGGIRNTTGSRLGVRWEGPLFAHHSFATVNREIAAQLSRRADVDLGLVRDAAGEAGGDGGEDGGDGGGAVAVDSAVARRIGHRPAVTDAHVRHRWPPDFTRPPAGRFVLAQPWEFSQTPAAWVAAITASVDEVWTPSTFARDAFLRSGVAPETVTVIPHGVNPAVFHPGTAPWRLSTRATFRFLFVGGAIERKGFDVLLRAYVREFTADDDVCLVVKDFHYGDQAAGVVADLAGRRRAPEIAYSYGDVAPATLGGLYTACDAYVQPYRGEGFGLPIVEAMACGLAVIATGAGPMREHASHDTAYLIDADEVAVPQVVWHPALATAEPPTWYEPDEAHLRRVMRHVAEHRDEATRTGARASAHILATRTWGHTADAIVARLKRSALTA